MQECGIRKSDNVRQILQFENETIGSTSAPLPAFAINQYMNWLKYVGFKDVYSVHTDSKVSVWYGSDENSAHYYSLFDIAIVGNTLELHENFMVNRRMRNQTIEMDCMDSMPTDSQINFALSKVFDCGDFENIDGYKVARLDGVDTYIGVSVSPFKGELPTLIADYREVEHSRFE